LTRREAILALLREKRNPGYIPVSTYGVDRFSHPWMAEDPSYQEVLEYIEQYDHIQASFLSYYASFGLTDILTPDDPERLDIESMQQENMVITRYTLHTPKGDLSAEYKDIKGNKSTWREIPLVKTDEDIDTLMSMPFKPAQPNVAAYQHLKAALGDRGIVQVQVPNPVCLVIENMDFTEFMVRTITMPERLDAMLNWAQQLVLTWLTGIIGAGIGESFRIFGAEYCQPPQMRLSHYQRAVTNFDRPLVDMIHTAGDYVQYHCHGPIRALLDDFLELGVDAIDPCECLPAITGDITLREIAERAGHDLVIMGNVQLDDIERAEQEKIDRLVAQAIEEINDRAPFMLMPTAPPFTSPLGKNTARNLIQFIDSARRCGAGLSSG
jgi:hypothetical protein